MPVRPESILLEKSSIIQVLMHEIRTHAEAVCSVLGKFPVVNCEDRVSMVCVECANTLSASVLRLIVVSSSYP